MLASILIMSVQARAALIPKRPQPKNSRLSLGALPRSATSTAGGKVIAKPAKWCRLKQGFRRCFLGFILLVAVALPAHAEDAQNDLSSRQMEIMQTVMSVEGFITKELHSEFWASFSPAIRDDAMLRGAIVRFLDRSIAAGVRFQRESWASIKASLEAGRVVKSPGYAEAKKGVLSASTIPQYKRQSQRAVANSEGMIEAAAEGKPFQSPRGPIYITPEVVNQVLAGLDGSLARFRRLANPDWEETVTEHRYPEAHVAILSQVPFAVERQELAAENGRNVKMISLTNRLNETDFIGIMFSDYGQAWADPEGAIVNTVKETLRGTGAIPSLVFSVKWRGRLSASGNGEARTSVGTLYASTRVVEMRELGGALVFMAITLTSKVEADMLREDLERSTQLLQ